MTPDKFGKAGKIEEVSLSDDSKVTMVTGVPENAKTINIFLRGSNSLVSK